MNRNDPHAQSRPSVTTVTRYLATSELRSRWDCGKSFVYTAIARIDAEGYLKRFWLGKHQRIALESVEAFERMHLAPEGEIRSMVIALREANAKRRIRRPPALPTTQLSREERIARLREFL